MPESPMVGARVSLDWHQQIQEIANASGRKEAFVVRFVIAQYLGRTAPGSIKGARSLLARPSSQLGAQASRAGAASWINYALQNLDYSRS